VYEVAAKAHAARDADAAGACENASNVRATVRDAKEMPPRATRQRLRRTSTILFCASPEIAAEPHGATAPARPAPARPGPLHRLNDRRHSRQAPPRVADCDANPPPGGSRRRQESMVETALRIARPHSTAWTS